ncbi:MAG: hypothetical protein H0V29_02460 [Thermoleophilaceae bacterium]|nr:hypothetical protein [Thermoleophilaceae bacterium]
MNTHKTRARRATWAALAAVLSCAPSAASALDTPQLTVRAKAAAAEPAIVATPQAGCEAGSRPEPSIQGRLPKSEVDSGRADRGYWCNLSVVGRSGNTGGFRVHRYVDKQRHECAYYDTALLFPTNALSLSAEPTGVAVLDMSNPAKPVRTTTLLTPAMQTPHESLNISVKRGVLAAVLGNPAQYPGGIDVYDISNDCRYPEVKAAGFPATPFGHESGMAPDGNTFYPSSPAGPYGFSAVDISNPMLPRTLVSTNSVNTHGMSVSDDGRRGYHAVGNGLVITDLSDVQERKPNPQVRSISSLTWSNVTIPQYAEPVTIGGKPYLFEVDEYSENEGGSATANGSRVGAARMIDISDERAPRVVSNIRLQVHQPESRAAIGGDYGAQSPVQGYAAHYCAVPQRSEPGLIACSMIASGLRVFDIRDPERPVEVAYFMAPPSTISATGGPTIDERSNWAMSQPAFAPERREVWYSDGNSGFYALRLSEAAFNGTSANAQRSGSGTAGGAGSRCLPRRLKVTSRAVGRVRVGAKRAAVLKAAGAVPKRTTKRSLRFCVERGGSVLAALDRRGRVTTVVSTAKGHRAKAIARGTARKSAERRFKRSVKVRPSLVVLYRGRNIAGVKGRRVRFVGAVDRKRARSARALRSDLRKLGL